MMKIRVQRKDGRIEILELHGELSGPSPAQNELGHVFELRHFNAGGVDHYFDLEGYYDGWGGAVNCNAASAEQIIEAMEQKRKIED